jgi:hypothetical protein
LDLNELFSDQAMGFAVDSVGCLRVWCVDQTRGPPAAFIEPILEILDSVLPLQLHIGRMRLGDVFGRYLSQLMNVDV